MGCLAVGYLACFCHLNETNVIPGSTRIPELSASRISTPNLHSLAPKRQRLGKDGAIGPDRIREQRE
jgi:hypothetical protein